MSRFAGWLYALRATFRRSSADREIAEEIAFHVECESSRLARAGVEPDEARRIALTRFGGATRWREEAGESRRFRLIEDGWRDVVIAARGLLKRPAFTIPALLTLALGIGANAAVFSVLRGVVLRPLPYHEPQRLAAIWPRASVSYAELVFLQQHTRSFESVAAFSPGWGYAMTGVGEPMQVDVARTSANFFRTLGVAPSLGRDFLDSESSPGQATVVMLSHALWSERFGAATDVVGRVVSMNDLPHRIVGVMPPSFEAFEPGVKAWIPLEVDPASPFYRGQVATAFGRLRQAVSVQQAQSELTTLVPRLRALLEAPRDYGANFTVTRLHDEMVADSRQSLFVLFGAASFIALIAAANYGNLLLLRASSRRREVALRAALGASRARLGRQFLTESLVLSTAGGMIGLLVGALGVRALRALLPQDLPRLASVTVDAGLLAACAVLAVIIGVACGVAPALLATRSAQHDALREAGGIARAGSSGTLRGALVVVEFAAALVLLVGAGLMLQTIWRMQRVDAGFDPRNVLTFRLQPVTARLSSSGERAGYYEQLLARIAALPEVERVGTSQHLPLTGFNWSADLEIDGQPISADQARPRVTWRIVSGDYFGALGVPLRAGRALTRDDRAASELVVVINETMARRFWPNADPIGRRIRLGRPPRQQWVTIVGVVGDVRFRGLSEPSGYEVYRPLTQVWQSSAFVVVRSAGDPMAQMSAIRTVIREHDSTVPISAVRPMTQIVSRSFGRTSMVMMLLVAFAAVGVALGAIGIYGVISYDVGQRTREIGIRAALGAGRGSVLGLVLRRAGWLALLGIVLGSVVSLAAAHALESFVFGVQVRDPMTYAALSGLLLATAMLAAYAPARRAMRVDPVSALRSD